MFAPRILELAASRISTQLNSPELWAMICVCSAVSNLLSVRMSFPISPMSDNQTCLEVSSHTVDEPTESTFVWYFVPRLSAMVDQRNVSSESPSTPNILCAVKIASPAGVGANPYIGLEYGLRFPSNPDGNDSSGTPWVISSKPE